MAADTPILTPPVEAVASAAAAAGDDPLWYKDAIIYEAHVKSFFDSDNDGVGDFAGLTQKLDYLQGLGVTCLWLLPFFPSPLKDDGYDVADYLNIHPQYGTLDDFKTFVHAAHERHIKVLFELVVNHTSDQHPWFQRARHAPPGSPEREFYVWSDSDKGFAETRTIFCDAEASNWTYDPVAKQYYWHRFFAHQADLNLNNPAVVEAVIDVMKFWLDLGVDALRLDAVAYLCVREGSSNENLEETHDVLKRVRRALDAAYTNRMLLAEANQWPSDVRPYFGDGDECHMAFHFPLMPRMFMALRQEDRHAITEIMSQTPDIPATCQWALFLRNHDELTLEMVTDEERDYMYQVYATDPKMRLNLGIRRRLAPLVENSRRRMELLNLLLFSLPGTPIVYYGDEIGMGDNIYLGDRNGVRTPMQWSSDRNGGFSRADPARLVAPPIMDPVYGYQAINVEAQERYPFSLLNWMKRLIAMRKQHRVFGRGSLEFVACANRKVLAYVRRDDRETMLAVVNLSRTVQPAELDLKAFAGLVPVEMWGLTAFPRIGEPSYFLTLGPYSTYWFMLHEEPMQVTPRAAAPIDSIAAAAESLPSLLMGSEWRGMLDAGTARVLERQALMPFLQRQPWFPARSTEVRDARFSDWAVLRTGTTPAFLTIVTVEDLAGGTERYLLPLALLNGDAAVNVLKHAPGSALARITGARKGIVADGWQDDEVCDRLLALVQGPLNGKAPGGPLNGKAPGGPDETAGRRGLFRGIRIGAPVEAPAERKWVRGAAAERSNVALLNDRYVLKMVRRLEPGPHPEVELGRLFVEQGFSRTAPLAGSIEYDRPGDEPATIALVQAAVKHQGSGWEYSINDLQRYFESVAARVGRSDGPKALDAQDDEPSPFFLALERWYLSAATTLGWRTAEMHLTLLEGTGSAFAPEPMTRGDVDRLAGAMRAQAEASFDLLQHRMASLGDATRAQAEAVLGVRDALTARFDHLRGVASAGLRMRVHGDYHLGQVLRTEEDFVIIDFEGEPGRPLSQRRAKQSPLKDVGGMVRSFGHAAYAALFGFAVHAPEDATALEPWADTWQRWSAEAFLTAYRSAIAIATTDVAPVPQDDGSFRSMLHAFVLDETCCELTYELNNRPEWVRIPLAGLLKLANPLQS